MPVTAPCEALYRAAVNHQRRQIKPGRRHDCAGNGLVAAGDGNDGSKPVGAHGQLNGIGDNFQSVYRALEPSGKPERGMTKLS
jgi:hypothetical protein